MYSWNIWLKFAKEYVDKLFLLSIIGRILTQRRQHYAVLHSHSSDLQWLEKLWDLARLWHGKSTSRRILSWREVGNARCRSVHIMVFGIWLTVSKLKYKLYLSETDVTLCRMSQRVAVFNTRTGGYCDGTSSSTAPHNLLVVTFWLDFTRLVDV